MGAVKAQKTKAVPEPKTPLIMQGSFAPLETKVEALKLLEKGVKPEDLAEEMKKSGATERANEAAQNKAEEAKRDAALYDAFLLSLLRARTAKIEGLKTVEMEDVAAHFKPPEVSFNEWKRRVGE